MIMTLPTNGPLALTSSESPTLQQLIEENQKLKEMVQLLTSERDQLTLQLERAVTEKEQYRISCQHYYAQLNPITEEELLAQIEEIKRNPVSSEQVLSWLDEFEREQRG
jgi:hypothetical protein